MRVDQALKALWIIQAKCGDLSAKVFEKLFVTLVAPVLDYGSAASHPCAYTRKDTKKGMQKFP